MPQLASKWRLSLIATTLVLMACDATGQGLVTVSVTPQPTTMSMITPAISPPALPTSTPAPTANLQVPPTNTPKSLPTSTSTLITLPSPTDPPSPSPTATPGSATSVLAESAHPYAKYFDNTWLLSNPDAQPGGTRAHFSRLELEKDVDWLILMDGKGAEMQRFTGSFPDGVWAEAIPGSLVKLRLISDGSVQQWGFTLDKLEAVSYTSLDYSPHPYPDNAKDLHWTINNTEAGAQGTKIHFSRVELEENVDWLVISDLTETSYQWITGQHPDGLWTVSVPGNGVVIKLISDGSVQQWGFNIDTVQSAPPEKAETRPDTNKSLAESAHPMGSNGEWSLVNSDASAAYTKVHFTRLELSGGELTLLDGNDKSVQVLSGSQQGDFWSDDIPGRVVKIKLDTHGYSSPWGFRIDQLANGSSKSSLAESAHTMGSNGEWTMVNQDPTANFTKVHFTRLELSGGELTLLDGNDKSVQVLSGSQQGDFWSDDIPGRVVKIKLDTHGYSSPWGFRIDQLANGEP